MKEKLIHAVIEEMRRVWGCENFEGGFDQYDWLLENYGLSEVDDVYWQLILQYEMNDLPEEDANDTELMEFLGNDGAVIQFLEEVLQKYRSSPATYSPTSK